MNSIKSAVPLWYWILSGLALLWNLMGVGSFFVHTMISDEKMAALPEAERALYESYPMWTYVVFALAVFCGFFGCVGLLMRKKWAKPILLVSMVAVIVQMFHSLVIANSIEVYGPGAIAMPVMVVFIGIALYLFAISSIKKGWLN